MTRFIALSIAAVAALPLLAVLGALVLVVNAPFALYDFFFGVRPGTSPLHG